MTVPFETLCVAKLLRVTVWLRILEGWKEIANLSRHLL